MKTGLALNEPCRTGGERETIQRPHKRHLVREAILAECATVAVAGSQYLVDFGAKTPQRFHRVSKNKDCSCGAPYCEAIEAVRQYLQAGGVRAPDPESAFTCPICGSKTYRDRNWDGKFTRELGWRCSKGGLHHFLEAKAERIKKQQAENPWLIPPASGYPGVRRDEILTWEECQALNRKVFLETGYDPTA
jgi:hypothetical protein